MELGRTRPAAAAHQRPRKALRRLGGRGASRFKHAAMAATATLHAKPPDEPREILMPGGRACRLRCGLWRLDLGHHSSPLREKFHKNKKRTRGKRRLATTLFPMDACAADFITPGGATELDAHDRMRDRPSGATSRLGRTAQRDRPRDQFRRRSAKATTERSTAAIWPAVASLRSARYCVKTASSSSDQLADPRR